MEQITRFAILPVFWEPGGQEMITPTMKLKRAPIAAKYAGVIESLYAGIGEPAQAGPDSGRKCTGLDAA